MCDCYKHPNAPPYLIHTSLTTSLSLRICILVYCLPAGQPHPEQDSRGRKHHGVSLWPARGLVHGSAPASHRQSQGTAVWTARTVQYLTCMVWGIWSSYVAEGCSLLMAMFFSLNLLLFMCVGICGVQDVFHQLARTGSLLCDDWPTRVHAYIHTLAHLYVNLCGT